MKRNRISSSFRLYPNDLFSFDIGAADKFGDKLDYGPNIAASYVGQDLFEIAIVLNRVNQSPQELSHAVNTQPNTLQRFGRNFAFGDF